MNVLRTDLFTWLMPVVGIAIAFFSWRSMTAFWRQVKHNREAGVYDDPGFKRRIRPLNILRYSLVTAELLAVVPAIWAIRVAPEIWFPVVIVFVLAITIVLYVVDRRWSKLMTKGED